MREPPSASLLGSCLTRSSVVEDPELDEVEDEEVEDCVSARRLWSWDLGGLGVDVGDWVIESGLGLGPPLTRGEDTRACNNWVSLEPISRKEKNFEPLISFSSMIEDCISTRISPARAHPVRSSLLHTSAW